MINDVWPVLFENIIHPVGIPHGTDEHFQIQIRIFSLQFLLDIIGIILVNIHNDQLFWIYEPRSVCKVRFR